MFSAAALSLPASNWRFGSHFDGAVEFTLKRSIDLERCYRKRHCQRDGRTKTDEKLFADGPRCHYLLQNYGLKSKASVTTALVGSPFALKV